MTSLDQSTPRRGGRTAVDDGRDREPGEARRPDGTRLDDYQLRADPPPGRPITDAEFWASRASLTAIYEMAYARTTAPWSLLGACLARAIASVPPWIELPPIVGGRGSLNFFAAIVGRSGAGKGSSETVAAELVLLDPDEIPTVPTGSGEGLAHIYMKREGKDLKRVHTRALVSVPEIDALASISGRQGSTIMSKLRSVYSGEEIGFMYADERKRLLVGPHEYRMALIVAVQPERAGLLLNDSAGGTPQRFVWLPANDPMKDTRRAREHRPIPIPDERAWMDGKGESRRQISIPEVARQTIKDAALARVRGESDALDGHALQTREKVMVALAVLDGRTEPTEDDWNLSAVVMRKSDQTRAEIVATLEHAEEHEAERDGRLQGVRREASDQTAHERKVDRRARRIVTAISRHGRPMESSALQQKFSSTERKETAVMVDAIDGLIADRVLTRTGHGPNDIGKPILYQLTPRGRNLADEYRNERSR